MGIQTFFLFVSFFSLIYFFASFIAFPTSSFHQQTDLPPPSQTFRSRQIRSQPQTTELPQTESPSPSPSTSSLPSPWSQWEHISIVILWVDGGDPEYRKLRRLYRPSEKVGGSRDRNSGELIHSLRSVEKYMPWHKGTIFLVTPGQTPSWLNTSHPRIKVIDQDSLLPDLGKVIPTFNSLVVEYFLAKIPGLTDVFFYMNDDMFFGQPIYPWHFFTEDGAPKIYFENLYFKTNYNLTSTQWWMKMLTKTSNLLDIKYGPAVRYRLKHVPIVYYKEIYQRVHSYWPNEIYDMLPHRFRNPEDVIFTFFHTYVLIHEGFSCCKLNYSLPTKEEKENAILYVVQDDENAMFQLYKDIWENPPRIFTLNDAFKNEVAGEQMGLFLHDMYPEPSSFELKTN